MDQPLRVLLALNLTDAQVQRVRDVDPRLEVRVLPRPERRLLRGRTLSGDPLGEPPPGTQERLHEALAWADTMLVDQSGVRENLPGVAPRLRWVHVTNAGIDYLVRRGLHRVPITITNSRGMHGRNMGEYVVMMMLAFCKALPQYLHAQRRHEWSKAGPDELHGKTLGIIGYGAIGHGVAAAARAMGVRVLGTRRRATGAREEGADAMYPMDRLHEMLAECDFVLSAMPWTPDTDGVLGAAEFAAMKRDTVFINIGRGTTVDEPALIEALRSGHLGGAALDVLAEEPPSPDNPLWDLENVLITPHTSGNTPYYYDGVLDIFCESLRRVLDGEAPLNIVDVAAGY